MHRKEYTRFPSQKTCSIIEMLHEIDRRLIRRGRPESPMCRMGSQPKPGPGQTAGAGGGWALDRWRDGPLRLPSFVRRPASPLLPLSHDPAGLGDLAGVFSEMGRHGLNDLAGGYGFSFAAVSQPVQVLGVDTPNCGHSGVVGGDHFLSEIGHTVLGHAGYGGRPQFTLGGIAGNVGVILSGYQDCF